MKKYLYLTEVSWADAWVGGGKVPVSMASKYKREDRTTIYTPDENLIHDSPVDLKSLHPFISIEGNVKNLSITNSTFNGKRVPDIVNASYYVEDGGVLSFCDVFSPEIAQRFEKSACVEIGDVIKLKRWLDKRLGLKSIAASCEYTLDHRRSHFLKHDADSWQQEYRLFWKGMSAERWVQLFPGAGKLIWVKK
ncbi:hypothetical protein [Pseudomonas oryzihabitans]|uniref:hypothetical protein n=1 Tax=Pseudomonas oryzihabitans TaxID=47885 RepID=UPI000944B9C3|nr:hypothetical protein [Pseudomonas psychrotolerans]NMY89784.1 hypothetical protein [Pseudomonas psychrotolerans]